MASARGIKRLPGFEHCNQHGQEAVGDAPQCAAMLVADAAQLGVVTLAVRVVQNATASQMVDGIAKSLAASTPHDHLPALAALPGDRCCPAVSPECIVIPLGQRI